MQIGATVTGTTPADIIVTTVNAVADGQVQGMGQFVYDPRGLKDIISMFSKSATPRRFIEGVGLRRKQTQTLDDLWSFPLNLAVPCTCPLPWTLIEATVKSQVGSNMKEYNIMRTVDFIGRNYIRIVLPMVDTSAINDGSVSSTEDYMSEAQHTYLGAWHRDLVPRIIQRVELYPRSSGHRLFEYTGYDIYVHNILFGNAKKAMNDLMCGEDMFELCYDPYRVHGSAGGMRSFKGIDAFSDYTIGIPEVGDGGFTSYTPSTRAYGIQDGIIDYFQIDDTMDYAEFRNIYRHDVWYEAPVAKNYYARHSIHSRRMVHQTKELTIPLDILPFGYSVAASLSTGALGGEVGFIKITTHDDWFDRSFYLTKISDVPNLHPIANHLHTVTGDTDDLGNAITDTDPRIGWVNDRSIGRFGDPMFTRTDGKDDEGFGSDARFSTPGSVAGAPRGYQNRDSIMPNKISMSSEHGKPITKPGVYPSRAGNITAAGSANRQRTGLMVGARRHLSTSIDSSAVTGMDRLMNSDDPATYFIHKPSSIDSRFYADYNGRINIKLMQVGYMSLPCVRELLTKLPNIYITSEWKDDIHEINDVEIDIRNDLYIQGIIMWVIPRDPNGIDSMRVYPCHTINHEMPVMAGLVLRNTQSQGTTVYTWDMMNLLTPAQMGLNPLIENMGLISFSPTMAHDKLPHAYYDTNVSGYLQARFIRGVINGNNQPQWTINIRDGHIRVISIGINGLASVNQSLFRLVF